MNKLAALLLSLLLLPLLVLSSHIVQAEGYSVGVVTSLTGKNEAYGSDIRRGFDLAKEILKADEIELVFEDDACEAAKGVSAVTKLVSVNRVDAISGLFCNSVLLPVAPILSRSGVPTLTTGATTGDATGVGKKIFRLFPSDQQAVAPLLREINRTHHHLCLVSEIESYTNLMDRTIRNIWPTLNPENTLFGESVNAGEQDYRSVFAKFKNKGCDTLLLNSSGDDVFISAFKQSRDILSNLPVATFYFPGSSTVSKALGTALNGAIYADIVGQSEYLSPSGVKMVEEYRKRYGDFQVSLPSAILAYEAFRVIYEAHRRNIPLDKFLRNPEKDEGALFKYDFDEDGAVRGVPFGVFRYQDGKLIAQGSER